MLSPASYMAMLAGVALLATGDVMFIVVENVSTNATIRAELYSRVYGATNRAPPRAFTFVDDGVSLSVLSLILDSISF